VILLKVSNVDWSMGVLSRCNRTNNSYPLFPTSLATTASTTCSSMPVILSTVNLAISGLTGTILLNLSHAIAVSQKKSSNDVITRRRTRA